MCTAFQHAGLAGENLPAPLEGLEDTGQAIRWALFGPRHWDIWEVAG